MSKFYGTLDTIMTIQSLLKCNGSAQPVMVALTQSDSRLIAAAPDLLEAAKLFAFARDAWLEIVHYMNDRGDAAPSALALAFERNAQSIAKATGEA